jgi:murein L,D-transpeptidase YafK
VFRKFLFLLAGLVVLGGVLFLYAHHNWNPLPPETMIDRVVVEKAARRLSTFHQNTKLKTYRVALGENPVGAKEVEGDLKTPEGIYQVDGHKPDSDFHLALHLSYPSPADTERATARGVSAGCDIEIHGLPNGHDSAEFHPSTDWTAGCIAVTDAEIEELYRLTPDGTLVEIRP